MQCDVLRIYEDALTAKIFFKKTQSRRRDCEAIHPAIEYYRWMDYEDGRAESDAKSRYS